LAGGIVIYICIPVYNEERTIGVVLWKIRQVMAEFGRDYEVLVVDDASTDGTDSVMAPYARIMPVHVRRHERREGYAPSLEALIRGAVGRSRYPKRDVVVTLQGDFTDEPEDMVQLLKRVEGGADLVTARIRPVASDMPRVMRWSRRIWHVLLRRVGGRDGAGDLLSGFRAYRVVTLRKALDAAGPAPLLTTDGWAANAELYRKVAPHARRVEAVDVQLRYARLQRESRFQPLETSRDLLRLLRAGPVPAPAGAPPPAEAASGAGLAEERGRGRRGGRGAAGDRGARAGADW
jgi:glycosyltransferase involved in cell wall biosynthesis